ncbi:MAG: hypothetical protein ACLGIM_10070 [Alphaproteobacteria bacterium]
MINLTVSNPAAEIDHLFSQIPFSRTKHDEVRDRMMAEGRYYHGLYHLASMWRLHRLLKARFSPSYFQTAQQDREIACAIAYHDVILDPNSKTNEIDSARYWERDFNSESLIWSKDGKADDAPDISAAFVTEAIIATATHFNPDRTLVTDEDRRREWFIGLDLAALAVEARQFDINTGLIRLEYAHLTDDEWKRGRGGFIGMVAETPVIYRDAILRDLFEARARANIARVLVAP